MASLISGFEYDIFISYRQKDNKGEKWVSEFVEALRIELESTFKEEISVYFDVNPHDGLLETQDVDATLKKKLKCLVFIPVISRTYCDPKSFAWQQEFIAFVEQAANDQFGLKISLPNGNVINRILPVRIHELDNEDIRLCESVLGGTMRGVEFVYKSSGVNRPLRPVEDHPHDNSNKTYYRDQINKVANSLKDIIQAMHYAGQTRQPEQAKPQGSNRIDSLRGKKILSRKLLSIILIAVFLVLCVSGIYIYTRVHSLKMAEKTIAIIPMTNPSHDDELEMDALGSMEAINSKLNEIKSLNVRGLFTSLQYLNTAKTPDVLRKELNSNYLIFIILSKTGSSKNIWIGLTETRKDKQLWNNRYEWNGDQLMPLFSKVVQIIGDNLNIDFSEKEVTNIEKDLTKDPKAYMAYLNASSRLLSLMGSDVPDSARFRSVIKFYDKAIEYDHDFASAYARRAIARSWGIHFRELDTVYIKECLPDIIKAEKINKDLLEVQIAYGFYYYYCTREYTNALLSFNTASVKNPENYKPLFYMALVYRAMGNWTKAQELLDKVIKLEPKDPLDLTNIGITFDYMHYYDSAIIFHQKAIEIKPDWLAAHLNKVTSLISKYGNTAEARASLNSILLDSPEKLREILISLDIYDQNYAEALTKTKASDPMDFVYRGGARFMYLGNISTLLNEKSNAMMYYDSARINLIHQVNGSPGDYYIHGLLGQVYAASGMKDMALTEGRKAVQLAIANHNKMNESEMIVNLAQIYTTLGLFEEALSNIEYSLRNPSLLSAKLLQIDPAWRPLINNREFKALIAKYDK